MCYYDLTIILIQKRTKVVIFNQAGEKFETDVIELNSSIDYVVVRSKTDLISKAPDMDNIERFERYVLIVILPFS